MIKSGNDCLILLFIYFNSSPKKYRSDEPGNINRQSKLPTIKQTH